MATSVQVSYSDPRRSLYQIERRACFGNANRLMSSNNPQEMQTFEWQPELSEGSIQRRIESAMEVINSFGMWNGVYWRSPASTVCANLREHRIDQIITGLMTMREVANSYFSTILENDNITNQKINIILTWLGYYWDRYNNRFLCSGSDQNESTTVYLQNNTDAFALYLLVYGTAEDFEGCWPQDKIGEGYNTAGYLRNGSNRLGEFRNSKSVNFQLNYVSMADWLHCWLLDNPPRFEGKLGRLTISQFKERIGMRTQNLRLDDVKETIKSMFEELRDMYL